MRFFKRFNALLAAALFLLAAVPATSRAQGAGEVVLVLPFENTSNQREFNWIGESFADSLTELLGAHGLRAVTSDERELVYQRTFCPRRDCDPGVFSILPSRATALRMAREAGATMVVLGTYKVSPAANESGSAEVSGSVQTVRVGEGRIAGKVFFGDSLVNLQTVQGKLAYDILVGQDKNLPFSQKVIVDQATKVPPKAFESYVKGTMVDDPEKKPAYLQNAMREFERANPGTVYSQAAFELGHLFYNKGDFKQAAEYFSMLQRQDSRHAEAAFYAALSYWRMGETQNALGALTPLTSTVPLTSVYNNAGALSVESARSEKDTAKRDALLTQANNYLRRAVESSPGDAHARFNYAYALMLAGRHADAAEQLREIVQANPRDGAALFLFAKALERSGQTEAAGVNDNEARRFFSDYAEAQVEWQKSQGLSRLPVRLRDRFNRVDYVLARREQEEQRRGQPVESAAQELLNKARAFYTQGRDDEALMELRNVVRIEPMNAEAYLLTGRIYQRRGELDLAVSQLKATLFWEPKQIDAHVLLGRIFLERGDRAQALAHARSAMQIDPTNQEAIALQRQLEVGAR